MKFTVLIFLSACSLAMADLGYYFIGVNAGFSSDGPDSLNEALESGDELGGDNYYSLEFGWGVNTQKFSQSLSAEFISFDDTNINENSSTTTVSGPDFFNITETVDRQGRLKAESYGIMLNYKLYYNVTDRFRIFGGAGIGWFYNDFSFNSSTVTNSTITSFGESTVQEPEETADSGAIDEWTFGYQFNVGLEFGITKNLSILGQYRYISTGDLDGTNTTVVDRGFFDIGARYYF